MKRYILAVASLALVVSILIMGTAGCSKQTATAPAQSEEHVHDQPEHDM